MSLIQTSVAPTVAPSVMDDTVTEEISPLPEIVITPRIDRDKV